MDTNVLFSFLFYSILFLLPKFGLTFIRTSLLLNRIRIRLEILERLYSDPVEMAPTPFRYVYLDSVIIMMYRKREKKQYKLHTRSISIL
ncbi:MAG: hypothetical protein WBN72_08070 [Nitrososphaeraceae archaeon]